MAHRGLLDPLFGAATCENEELAQVRDPPVATLQSTQSLNRGALQRQLAAEIIADAFALTSFEDPLESENLVETIWYAAHRLLQTKSMFEHHPQSSDSSDDSETEATVCKGLSRIACSLAINHTAVLFSPEMNKRRKLVNGADAAGGADSFVSAFLEYLLSCSAHGTIDVMEPTLEFWFFFLDKSTQSGSLWHLLTTVSEQEHVLSLLGRLVNALIDHCRFPAWFIDAHQLTSDDSEVEAIVTVRRCVSSRSLALFCTNRWC